jgi:hypothetical protein
MNQHPIQYLMDRPEPSKLFLEARQLAGVRLQEQFHQFNNSLLNNRRPGFSWIKAELTYPAFDHLTFGYNNSIFSVLIELMDETVSSLTEIQRTRWLEACTEYNLIPCLFKINCISMSNGYNLTPMDAAWNLFDVDGRHLVNPIVESSDDDTEMSAWEIHNFAIQVVRQNIEEKGYEVLSFCDLVEVNPQIWFLDEVGNKNWVIVQSSTGQELSSIDPWRGIEQLNEHLLPFNGYFAGVQISSEKPSLYRGDGMFVDFEGLEQIYLTK